MPTSLFQYEMLPTTWFYLSSLLIVAVFFRFNRLFSVRNFDVVALIFLTPGLAYVAMGSVAQGYRCLAFVGAAIFARLALDVFLRRRPLLEPNLNAAGLTFACVASTAFMIPNLFINRGDGCVSPRAWRLEQILTRAADSNPNAPKLEDLPGYRPFLAAAWATNRFFAPSAESWRRAIEERRAADVDEAGDAYFFGVPIPLADEETGRRRKGAARIDWASGRGAENEFAPGFAATFSTGGTPNALPSSLPEPVAPASEIGSSVGGAGAASANGSNDSNGLSGLSGSDDPNDETGANAARGGLTTADAALILTVCALQIGIVLSTILIGKFHFGSAQTGVAAALFYLLHPYVNQFSGALDHIVPAFALLLAALFYRRPFVAGVAIGSAGSLVFYPFFLIPLWLSFYWKKGAARFAVGASAATLTFAVALLAAPESCGEYGDLLASMFGRGSIFLASSDGLWSYLPRFYRIPLIALFGVFCFGFALWPPRKNLATLLSCSALLTLGVQFWIGYRGGLYMAWFLPATILTVFRPNLEDRTASTTVVDV